MVATVTEVLIRTGGIGMPTNSPDSVEVVWGLAAGGLAGNKKQARCYGGDRFTYACPAYPVGSGPRRSEPGVSKYGVDPDRPEPLAIISGLEARANFNL